jgi:hypothetical protein
LAAARAHEPYVAGETLALEVTFGGADGHETTIDGRDLRIGVERVATPA